MGRSIACTALLGLLFAPLAVRGAEEIYSFRDEDGVYHFTNVPSDANRWKRLETTGPKPSASKVQAARRAARTPAAHPARTYVEYEAHVEAAAKKYSLPVELLRAVMAVESNYDPNARSHAGAMGLMQLMPGTAKDMLVQDVWDPAQNIDGGARYLRVLANLYEGDVPKVLAAYNAGPEAVKRARGVPRIPETQQYVEKVIALYQQFRERT